MTEDVAVEAIGREKGPAFAEVPGPTVRFRFTKHGKVRFTSHRDVARLWERALRRAGVGVVYSKGFSPRPRMAFGLALPTGHASDGEYVDLRLDHEPQEGLAILCARLSDALPEGITVPTAEVIPSGTPSLQEAVVACTWTAEVGGPTLETLTDGSGRLSTDGRLAALRSANSDAVLTESPRLAAPRLDQVRATIAVTLAADRPPIERERKGKAQVVDLRPAIHELSVAEDGADRALVLTAVLATRPASFRPEELVEVLDPSWRVLRACRKNQWIIDEDTWREPVPLVVPSPRAEVRAS
jgi:hypothetical protein